MVEFSSGVVAKQGLNGRVEPWLGGGVRTTSWASTTSPRLLPSKLPEFPSTAQLIPLNRFMIAILQVYTTNRCTQQHPRDPRDPGGGFTPVRGEFRRGEGTNNQRQALSPNYGAGVYPCPAHHWLTVQVYTPAPHTIGSRCRYIPLPRTPLAVSPSPVKREVVGPEVLVALLGGVALVQNELVDLSRLGQILRVPCWERAEMRREPGGGSTGGLEGI
eukprot:1195789-Prorocentrum_minimum.AAC.1